jgi:hypothetical protein
VLLNLREAAVPWIGLTTRHMAFDNFNRSALPVASSQLGGARTNVPSSGLFSDFLQNVRSLAVAAASAMVLASVPALWAQPAPEPLRITTLRPEYERFLIEWTGGLPPYAVEVNSGVEPSWLRISPLLRDTSYSDLHIDERPTGLYRILTFSDTDPPSRPTGLSAPAVKCDRAALVWDAQEDAPDGSGVWGYKIYRDGYLLKKLRAPDHHFTDEFLLSMTNYTYEVSTMDYAGNESELSPAVTVTTPDCISPSETNLVVNLAWDRSEDPHVVGYLVYRGSQPGVYNWQTDVMQETSYTFEDLSPGVTYFLSVTAYDEEGVESDPAGEVVLIP